MMRYCNHPFCGNLAHVKFCSDSCRAAFHQSHKARLEALAVFIYSRSKGTTYEDELSSKEQAIAFYRISHGHEPQKRPAKS